MPGVLDTLNLAQREAVEHEGGPLLVVAGAGSGKTSTLACRVASLVDRGVPPERILLLTFTRRAAREMLRRAEHFTGQRGVGRVWGGTFHAMGNRLLRLHGRGVGLSPGFTILDRSDTADLIDLVREELGFGQRGRRFPRKETLADVYSRTVNAQRKLRDLLERDYPWCAAELEGIRQIVRAYTERKRAANALDYDDLLLYWRALATSPSGAAANAAFEHVLVDEYQDTNALQADILAAMKPDGAGLTVVGDDAQAIYGFRAATVRNILEFPDRFPGTRIVRLERNYRSPQPILDASNAVIALSPQRHEKTLWTDRVDGAKPLLRTCIDDADQAVAVCRSVLEHRESGIELKEQAVLFRAAHHCDLLEVELARRNIPFVKYGGLKFLESAHVKDALAVLRICENPRDEVSWFRVLQLLDGVGPATARRLMTSLGIEDGGASRRLVESAPGDVPAAARRELEALREVVRACAATDPPPPAVQLEHVRRWLEPILRRRSGASEARIRDLEQLEVLAGGFPTRGRFVSELTLDPPSSTSDLAGAPLRDEDYLVLSTVHSAKGGEWDVVHVIHAADGMFPSDMATGDEEQIEEERRLFYVALTRARRHLEVSFPLRYHRRSGGREDRHWYAQLTRFLPPGVRAHFRTETTCADRAADGAVVAASGPSDGVDAYLAGLFASD